MRVVGRFLRAPRSVTFNVVNIEGLTLRLKHPSRDRGVRDGILIEVEDHFLTRLDFDVHETECLDYVAKVKL